MPSFLNLHAQIFTSLQKMSSSSRKCKGKGRRKVEMVKIENESNLHVTFSKRRGGVFKKASELTTLCAAEAAVVVFSPGNKPHSFGHPDVGTVADRFLSQNAPLTNDGDKLLEAHQRATLNQKTLELDRLYRQLELERKRAHELEGRRQHRPDLDYAQLAHLQVALLRFKDQFESRVRNAARLGLPYLPGAVMDSGRPNFIAGGPVQYDTMMGDSSILIPYSSTPSTPHES